MTGTNGYCDRSPLRAAVAFTLTTAILVGAPSRIVAADDSPSTGFSAALSNDLPPAQYGGYQHSGSPPASQFDRGFQFADPPPTIGGHADIRQTQYPLSNESPEELDRVPTTGTAPPHFVPPMLTPPVTSPRPSADGWGLEADLLGDFTYVIGRGNTLGITTINARAVMETPKLPGASLRPLFGWHFLNGPATTDLPSQLYDVTVEARMYWPFHDRLIGEFALAPGIFTDGDNTSGDALRLVGRGVAYYIWSPDVKLAGGATYLDRKDIQILPIAGVIWTPTPDHRLELLFPQPRIAHRYHQDPHHERWIYVSGELGGGSWAIQRTTGRDDVVSYRDLRFITGIEWKYRDGSSWRIEGGYVFGREVEYVSNRGNYDPGSTSMIRAAIVY